MGTHTFSSERDSWLEGFAAAMLLLAAIAGVIAFFPPEGRLLTPLHEGLGQLLGDARFLVPLGLSLFGVLAIVRRVRPGVTVPRRRLFGLALLTLAVLAGDGLLVQSSGLVGEWVTRTLKELIGTPLTVMLFVIVLAFGTGLALEVNPRRLMWFAKGQKFGRQLYPGFQYESHSADLPATEVV